MDYSPPGSSVHGILQARILEWVATSFSRGSSWPRDRTTVSCIVGRFFKETLQMRSTLKLFVSHGHWGDSESRGGLWDREALGIQTWIPGWSIAGPSPGFLAIIPPPSHDPCSYLSGNSTQWGLVIWPQDWDKWMNEWHRAYLYSHSEESCSSPSTQQLITPVHGGFLESGLLFLKWPSALPGSASNFWYAQNLDL